jgi:SPP1 family predicted phage head-tail adaptor
MNFGSLRHRVTLGNPGAAVPNGKGGYTQTYTAFGTRLPAAVEPASVRSLERIMANTTVAMATHVVTIRYLDGVTMQTRVTFHDGNVDRQLYVCGIQDPELRHETLALACNETMP